MNSKDLTHFLHVVVSTVLASVKYVGLLMLVVIVLIAFGFFFGGWR